MLRFGSPAVVSVRWAATGDVVLSGLGATVSRQLWPAGSGAAVQLLALIGNRDEPVVTDEKVRAAVPRLVNRKVFAQPSFFTAWLPKSQLAVLGTTAV